MSVLTHVESHPIDYQVESSISGCAELASRKGPLDWVIVATGILHEENLLPEKSLKDLPPEKLQRLFSVNSIVTAMVAKHFLPNLNKANPSKFAALSARAGSISDNIWGGWYSYRASKAALKMIIKNATIEYRRRNRQVTIVGLYPGMVQSPLSEPFLTASSKVRLFSPEEAVRHLTTLLSTLTPNQSGRFFDWDGQDTLP